MAVTGLANLAVKVADLDAACAFYEATGGDVRDRMVWNNGERADVYLGPVMITLFTQAIYEDAVDLPLRASSTRRCSPTISMPSWSVTPSCGVRPWSKVRSGSGGSRSSRRREGSASSSWSSCQGDGAVVKVMEQLS